MRKLKNTKGKYAFQKFTMKVHHKFKTIEDKMTIIH